MSNQSEPNPLVYSICIVRAERNIGNTDVKTVIDSLNLGYIERIQMKPMTDKNDEQYWSFLIHFSDWNKNNPVATKLQAKLDWGEKVKLVYDTPKYWIISKCKIPPFLDFTWYWDDEEEEE